MKLVDVEARAEYRVWLCFENGREGVIDLSDLAGRGVFRAWEDRATFEAVRITAAGALEWPGGLDLCGDALYLRLTGKVLEELFPTLKNAQVDA